jgi:hypothetical protein
MSRWSDARFDAERAVSTVLRNLVSDETTVTLAWCETQAALDTLNPENGWPVAYHQIVTRAAQRILLTRGAKVNVITFSPEAFSEWLGDRPATPETRALYCSSILGEDYVAIHK